jgi:hypothetical protein
MQTKGEFPVKANIRRLAAALLAVCLLWGIAPGAYAAGSVTTYPDYASFDQYETGDNWSDDIFFQGDRYWNSPEYWLAIFFYRDN